MSNSDSNNEETQEASNVDIGQTDEFEIDANGDENVVPLNQDRDNLAISAELEKCKKDYLYLRADFDNYKRSSIKERSDLIKFGSERLFADMLDVLDNFDRALNIELKPETLDKYREGIQLTAAEFKKVLNRFGVTELDCEGVAFDPNLHEALSSEATDSVPPGHVTRVFKKAYKLHDRILRPAQVVVAKEQSKN